MEIEDYLELTQGISPTYQEIADSLGITKAQVHRLVKALVDRGFVSTRYNEARSIKLRRLDNYGA